MTRTLGGEGERGRGEAGKQTASPNQARSTSVKIRREGE